MPPFGHMDGRFMDHPWWGFFGWFAPLLIVAMLVGLAAWALTRSMRQPQMAGPGAGWAPASPPPDAALAQVRMRYAHGEIGRDEFLRLAGDLGDPAAVAERPTTEARTTTEVPHVEPTPDAPDGAVPDA